MNYTKGNWKLQHQEILSGNKNIATVSMNQNEFKDNANLISASPDMYEALKVALWDIENGEVEAQWQGKPRLIERLSIYKKALAKAEGKNE